MKIDLQLKPKFVVFTFFLLLSACQTDKNLDPLREVDTKKDQELSQNLKQANFEWNHETASLDPLTIDMDEPLEEDYDFALFAKREEVKQWIFYFQNQGREKFQSYLNKGERYKPILLHLLKKYDMPTYLYYLALIESGFNTKAKSNSSAIGLWQFMSSTAESFGLRINSYIDERQDPIRSTIAAAIFLKILHKRFNSWFLAMASYNGGENRVQNAILRYGTRDFWELAANRALPKETCEYVPKFIAAALIGTSPEAYGFHIETKEIFPSVVSVKVPGGVHLQDIARVTETPFALLKNLNPQLKKDWTPPYMQSYRLWFPKKNWDLNMSKNKISEIKLQHTIDTIPPTQLAQNTTKKTKHRLTLHKNRSSSSKTQFAMTEIPRKHLKHKKKHLAKIQKSQPAKRIALISTSPQKNNAEIP